MLKRIFRPERKIGCKCKVNFSGPEDGPVADSCEHGNEHSGSIKCGEFLDYLRNYHLLKKDSSP
jgi:hypothetical protein